jgi:glutamine synthetase
VLRIARTQIYPVVMDFLERLARSLRDQEQLGLPPERSVASAVANLNQTLIRQCNALEQAIANPPHDGHGHLRHCADVLLPLMVEIRAAVDGLESMVDEATWPLPTYQEMLFVR